jgi:uncharacterized repeat protein (TIGR01451 family)
LVFIAIGFIAGIYPSHAVSPTPRDAAQANDATSAGSANRLANSGSSSEGASARALTGAEEKRVEAAYARLPIAFTANEGQLDGRVGFSARGSGYQLFLTQGEAVLSLSAPSAQKRPGHDSLPGDEELDAKVATESRAVLRMYLPGANPKARVTGEAPLSGKANYFTGSESGKWRTGVSMFEKVRYQEVYPGIDLVYYGNQRQLEYDFVIAPGADPGRIKLRFDGAREIYTDADGNLVLRADGGDVRQQKPFIYQLVDGERREVSGRYVVEPETVSFELGTYDRSEPLIIDPVLSYASFLGGNGNDQALAVALDAEGNAYITGQTESSNFPGASPLQSAKGSATDAYVLKINPSGSALVYATYLGGNGSDTGNSIAVDSAGNAYVTGLTGSGNFPTTAGALQSSKSGSIDAFATKLNAAGNAIAYSTFLGGNNFDQGFGIGVDASGNAYVTGRADSTTFLGNIPMPKQGSGAYKSADAGSNWAAVNNSLSDPNIESIVVDPTNSSTLYAAGSSGVFKSMDGGNFWRLTGQGRVSTTPLSAISIAVDPSTPSTIYAGTVSGVYKSVTAGDIWENSSNGIFSSASFVRTILIDPNTPSTLYAGTLNGIYKSTNSGGLWERSINPNGLPSNAQVVDLAFAPGNSSTLYAATTRGVYRSVDGAANWTSINNGLGFGAGTTLSIAALAVDPLSPLTIYAASNQNGIYKTTDGGANWSSSSNGLLVTPPGGMAIAPSISSIAINRITPSTLYAGTLQGGIFKSTNGGASWTASNNGLSNVSVRDIAVDHTAPNTMYVATGSGSDAFVIKLNQTGTGLGYLLYLGGDETDLGRGIAVDANGNAYLTGTTNSTNFPTLNPSQASNGGSADAFVTKLNTDGVALSSTYLGGNATDQGFGIAVNANGNAYVTGSTFSSNFPTAGTRQTSYSGGLDAFVSKFNTTVSSLDYSIYHGGTSSDQGVAIAVDATDSAYVTGTTSSTDFPAVDALQGRAGSNDAFVFKLNPASDINYSTYLGGLDSDQGMGIAVHPKSGAYVVGNTFSPNFPTASPLQATPAGSGDAFLARIGSAADLSITVAASRETVMVGNDLVYTLTVRNTGPLNATAVTVNSAITGNPNIVSATTTQGACSIGSGNVSCAPGALAAQATATVTIVVRPGVAGAITNNVSVAAAEFDPVAANNTATHTAQVSANPSIAGRVLNASGEGLAGVTLTLGGAQTATTTTDARGYYQFTGLTAGSTYIVTPAKTGYTFTPLSQTLSDVRQDAVANFTAEVCSYSLSQANVSRGSAGGSGSVAVTANGDCPWTATSNVPWITITSADNGRGNGVVTFNVAPANAPRSGLLTIAGRPFVVWQEFDSCAVPAFQQERSYLLSITPTELVTSDFNNDGKLDLAALQTLQGQNRVAVLLGDGVGGFGRPAYFAAGGNNRALASGDLNGDGNVDLVATDLFAIQILFGNGAGSFSAPNNFTVGTHFHYSTRVADFNRDGKLDLAVTYEGADHRNVISILLGNGNGTFGAPMGLYAGTAAPVADLDNDGKPDLVIFNENNSVAVRLGNGAGGFSAATTWPLAGPLNFLSLLSLKDVNGDGNVDIVAGGEILLGNGAGGFGAPIPIPGLPAQTTRWIISEDFNNDAKPDLMALAGNGLLVFPGDGTGHFGSPTTFPSDASNSPVVADFNGDGRPDVAMVSYDSNAARVVLNACQASPGISISGRVMNQDGVGIYRAYLTLSGTKLGTITMRADDNGYYIFRNLSSDDVYTLVPDYTSFTFVSRTIDRPTTDQVVNFTATSSQANGFRFGLANYHYGEGAGRATVTVMRVGDASVAASVDVTTVDDAAAVPCDPAARKPDGTTYPQGTAYARCDYATTIETVTFAAGDNMPKDIRIPLIDDGYAEGGETVQLRLVNPVGTPLGDSGMATITIADNDVAGASNPIYTTPFFVRMQYLDFLSREPEAGEPWSNVLNRCPDVNNDPSCDRIIVSYSFFGSPEFRLKGFYVFNFYRVAFNRLPEYAEVITDMRSVTGQTPAEVYSKRAAFAAGFMGRQEFRGLYDSLGDTAFVNTLLDRYGLQQIRTPDPQNPEGTAKVTLTKSELIARLSMTGAQALTRAQVLRAVVESDEVGAAEYNRAFVAMQYYGYLRRTPEEDGYQAWLRVINQDPNNIRVMVNGFMNSFEYRLRFGRQ